MIRINDYCVGGVLDYDAYIDACIAIGEHCRECRRLGGLGLIGGRDARERHGARDGERSRSAQQSSHCHVPSRSEFGEFSINGQLIIGGDLPCRWDRLCSGLFGFERGHFG